MALTDEVLARYSNQRLVGATNPDVKNPTGQAINYTRLNAATADVTADFLSYGGQAFSLTNIQHVGIACEGVLAYLTERIGTKGGKDMLEAFRARLTTLRETTSNDRVDPSTNGNISPSVEGSDGRPALPAFDQKAFGGVVPGIPRFPGGTFPTTDDDEDD